MQTMGNEARRLQFSQGVTNAKQWVSSKEDSLFYTSSLQCNKWVRSRRDSLSHSSYNATMGK
ncbi:hypothetical protein KSS87_005906 [Heliosperma pusillum]|nr:hypothetical protein KSS87_005906 [Heliosperma pusillum]